MECALGTPDFDRVLQLADRESDHCSLPREKGIPVRIRDLLLAALRHKFEVRWTDRNHFSVNCGPLRKGRGPVQSELANLSILIWVQRAEEDTLWPRIFSTEGPERNARSPLFRTKIVIGSTSGLGKYVRPRSILNGEKMIQSLT